MGKSLNIIDLTVREAGFRIAHQWAPEDVADLALEIERCGIPYMEICHGCGIGGFRRGFPGRFHDIDLLKAARKAAPKLKFSVYLDPGPHSVTELELVWNYFELGRIGVNTNAVSQIQEHARKLKGAKKQMAVQLLRIHRFTPEEVADAASEALDLGADLLYLVDSYGSLSGEDILRYFETVKRKISIPLGFQGRNNTQRALENSLRAVQAGAEWLDATLLGLGRDAGLANIALLISLFQREGKLTEANLFEVHNAAWLHLFPKLRTIPHPDFLDLLFAKHRIDFYPKEFIMAISEILEISPEEFLKGALKHNPSALEIGQQEIRALLEAEGLALEVVMQYLQTGKVPGAEETGA